MRQKIRNAAEPALDLRECIVQPVRVADYQVKNAPTAASQWCRGLFRHRRWSRFISSPVLSIERNPRRSSQSSPAKAASGNASVPASAISISAMCLRWVSHTVFPQPVLVLGQPQFARVLGKKLVRRIEKFARETLERAHLPGFSPFFSLFHCS